MVSFGAETEGNFSGVWRTGIKSHPSEFGLHLLVPVTVPAESEIETENNQRENDAFEHITGCLFRVYTLAAEF